MPRKVEHEITCRATNYIMKQHISVKQLDELSKKGKDKLRRWWKPSVGEWFITKYPSLYVDYGETEVSAEDESPQLLTGQPVDSGYYGWKLGENFPPLEYKDDEVVLKRAEEVGKDALPLLSIGQMIEFLEEKHELEEDDFGQTCIPNGEGKINDICDSLWQAVKEILEK